MNVWAARVLGSLGKPRSMRLLRPPADPRSMGIELDARPYPETAPGTHVFLTPQSLVVIVYTAHLGFDGSTQSQDG